MEVDYDNDEGGIFRAQSGNNSTRDAKVILDSTATKIDTPVDLQATQQIDEELLISQMKRNAIS